MINNPFLLAFLGGGLGSVARYAVGRYVQPWLGSEFPAGTLLVNLVASLVLGLVAGWMAGRQGGGETARLLVGVGFCGGLSTFSTFSTDTLALLQQGRISSAILNILLNVVLCLLVSWLGFAAGLYKLRSIL